MKSTATFFNTVIIILMIIVLLPLQGVSQFVPVPISGFNHDVIAESGTSSLTTTDIPVDGVGVSDKVIYTQTFRTLNSFGGGGIPDNGLITNGADNYQLAAYNSNNALLIPRNQNGDITLNTPAKYTSIRILCFSTEGPSLVNATLYFSDGSQTTALTNYTLGDWFNNTGNLVLSGFGRCTRSTPASGDDAYPDNPRMYYMQMLLSCTDQAKNLQKINIANVTTAGSNAPYPNTIILAVSAVSNTTTVSTTSIHQATCLTNGDVTIAVNNTLPNSITWNTTPLQTGNTATNLAPGNYIATIASPVSCTISYPVTIGLTNNLSLTAHIDTTICLGDSFNANTISNATGYNWTPSAGVSNTSIANPILSPTVASTFYTVTGTTINCNTSKSFTVTVNPLPILNIHLDTTICLGASFNANISGDGISYSWSPLAGVSNTSIANPVLSPTITTTYTVTSTKGNCSTTKTFTVQVVPGITVSAGNDITIIAGQSVQLQAVASPGIYLWSPSLGLSAINVLNPVAQPAITTIYVLKVTSPQGCIGSDSIDVIVVPYCIKPMNAITPNGDGINDRWLVTDGNCISNASVHVYNRYGSPVYENKDYKNDWQGTYKGKPVPDATYYFVIEYRLLDGREVFLKGNLTIIR